MSDLLAFPAPDTRNPFTGKGLAVTTALLLRGSRSSSLAQLAEEADVSRPLVSKVVRKLADLDLVRGDVMQGRGAEIRPRRALFDEAARRWPVATVWLQGGHPPSDVAFGGGDLAEQELGVLWESPRRIYVRTLEHARRVVALAGGAVVSEPVAEWEVTIVHFPFPPGPVPTIVLGLELGRTPRGRELLAGVRDRLFEGWVAR